MNTRPIALDLFAGTGWGVACQRLDIEEHGVEIMEEAVASRDAAGMSTIFRDVWTGLDGDDGDLDPTATAVLDVYNILIASPPCQTFSIAGKGTGRKALDDVLAAIEFRAYESPEKLRWFTRELDDRTALVLTPLTYAFRDRPTYVVLEQVPTVLPVWEACADVLRSLGYSVVTGVLNAEQYGVPQTRKRAILYARLDGVEATMPTPTHSRYYSRSPEKLDAGVKKWVSMAEALGWGMTERPYPTVASGTENGGTDPAALGGSGARRLVYGERARGAWAPSGDADNDGAILRLTDQDAAVLQSYPAPLRPELESWRWIDAPATTVAGDPRITAREHHYHGEQSKTSLTLEEHEAITLQSYPNGFPFQGAKGKRFLQIGNAVPPLLAQAILAPIALALALKQEVNRREAA